MFSSRSSGLSFGFFGLSVLSFVGAVAFVVYFPPLGTYIALALVVIGSFLMIISAIVKDRAHNAGYPTRESESQEFTIDDEKAAEYLV